ncbi:solute carrier family 53 member 1-like isoform X2 [Onthophagus taurus]|uniref:solute carrier family 53 member 1-like isoform X2 n=1 Tax=Onthophagus taurus TaxID=166361 RepID=UPI000C2050FB|nr:xenotropic and polytropic retrovirus receptor 1-like isoform X2 [Onthophagus taurus]
MKFAEHLSAHITPEWRKQYIHYEEMKAMLYMAVEEAPSSESVEENVVKRHYLNFDEQFFHYCDKELKKINTFYSEKLAEATRKFATLSTELKTSLSENKQRQKPRYKDLDTPFISTRKLHEFKTAFSEFYLSLILLQNYQSLNHTGFRKILKKHDKLLTVDTGLKWHSENVENAHFYINKDIDKIIQDTENTFITKLESGDRQKAMKKLRVPPLGEQRSPWTTFKVGLFSGSFIVLLIAVILSAIFQSSANNFAVAFQLYRGPLLIIEFMFLIGVNVYGWRSSGVNHVLIFELDPRNHLSEQDLMELAAIFGVIWALSVLSFLYSDSLSIPSFINPLSLTVIMLVFLINPLKVFRYDARMWFLKIFGRNLGAPFFRVNFADFWLADQLNSLAGALLDFQFLICFYIHNGDWMQAADVKMCAEQNFIIRPIVNCLPAWIRFMQCLRRYRDSKEAFPHLVNAGKYSTTFFVVIFSTLKSYYKDDYEDDPSENPFTYLWITAAVVSSCYAYTWDVKMDWGLFDKNAGENTFLREEIVYSSTFFYYFAIISDFILRFAWAISFFLTENKYISSDLMPSILTPLEVFRRFVWNYFRLENEHLNNCGRFRAVRDISVAPIDQSDQTQIIRMMDDEDGVVNRKAKRVTKKKEEKKPLLGEEVLSNFDVISPASTIAL